MASSPSTSISTSSSTPQSQTADTNTTMKARDVLAEEFFHAYRFDDILPFKLDILEERKEKDKNAMVYVVRVRTGPFADKSFGDFNLHVSSAGLEQLAHEMKASGYEPEADKKASGRRDSRENRERTVSQSPARSVASDVSASSTASDRQVLTSLETDESPSQSNGLRWSARRRQWQEFLQAICRSLLASTHPSLRNFLYPSLNKTDWHRLAMQHAEMVLSSEGVWEIEEPLPGIGWRLSKHYAIARKVDSRDTKLMMSWTFLGRKYAFGEVKERQEALKQILRLQHPLVWPIVYETFHEAGCLIMQPISRVGSLKDRIYRSRPARAFHRKYSRCHERRPFSLEEIRLYSRQILEALNVIHEVGIPYGSLHARNVMLENGVCRLADLHNTLIGLPGYYRPYLIQLPKISMFPSIDVYCFGRILYEMTFGQGLDAPCIDSIPANECPAPLHPLLNLLITTEACFEKGMPTVKFLLSLPLFRSKETIVECPGIRLSSRVVGICRGLAERQEKRLSEGEQAFHDAILTEGVFFRPISPILGRVKKSGSMQALKRLFTHQPTHRRSLSPGSSSFRPMCLRSHHHSHANDNEAETSSVDDTSSEASDNRHPTATVPPSSPRPRSATLDPPLPCSHKSTLP